VKYATAPLELAVKCHVVTTDNIGINNFINNLLSHTVSSGDPFLLSWSTDDSIQLYAGNSDTVLKPTLHYKRRLKYRHGHTDTNQ